VSGTQATADWARMQEIAILVGWGGETFLRRPGELERANKPAGGLTDGGRRVYCLPAELVGFSLLPTTRKSAAVIWTAAFVTSGSLVASGNTFWKAQAKWRTCGFASAYYCTAERVIHGFVTGRSASREGWTKILRGADWQGRNER